MEYIYPKKRTARLLILGLDNSGKSTFVNLAKNGMLKQFQPTRHPNNTIVKKKNFDLELVDMPGQEKYIKIWEEYLKGIHGIVYIIDIFDITRIEKNRETLHLIIQKTKSENIPILILINKIDCGICFTKSEILNKLNINFLTTDCKEDNPLGVYMTSMKYKKGYKDAINWVINQL